MNTGRLHRRVRRVVNGQWRLRVCRVFGHRWRVVDRSPNMAIRAVDREWYERWECRVCGHPRCGHLHGDPDPCILERHHQLYGQFQHIYPSGRREWVGGSERLARL